MRFFLGCFFFVFSACSAVLGGLSPGALQGFDFESPGYVKSIPALRFVWPSMDMRLEAYCLRMSRQPQSESADDCEWIEATQLPEVAQPPVSGGGDGAYYAVIWLRNSAGLESAPGYSPSAVFLDTTAPQWTPQVTLPTWASSTSVLGSVSYLGAAQDAGSGVAGYEWAVGSAASGSQMTSQKDWTPFTTSSLSVAGLSLAHDTTYYLHLRAKDQLGHTTTVSRPFQTDFVAPAAPTLVSPADASSITVPATSLYSFTGTCDARSGSTTTVASASTGVTILASSCTAGTLSFVARIASLGLGPRTRSVSVTTTRPNGASTSRQFNVMASSVCPANYIPVTTNGSFGTAAFCVAKFEMKVVDTNPTLGPADHYLYGDGDIIYDPSLFPDSRPDGTPWVGMTQREAIRTCDRLNSTTNGTGPYRLITNAQWQALTSEVLSHADNWSAGLPGSGSTILPRGNSDDVISTVDDGLDEGLSYTPVKGLAAASVDLTTHPWNPVDSQAELALGYRGTGNLATQGFGSGWEQRRTLMLSTSSDVIWDLAGNVWEFVLFDSAEGSLDAGLAGNDATHYNSRLLPGQSSAIPVSDWYELSDSRLYSPQSGGLLTTWFQPSVFWSTLSQGPSAFGLGRIYSTQSASLQVPLRGGSVIWGDRAGVSSVLLSLGPSSASAGDVGFRCTYNPP